MTTRIAFISQKGGTGKTLLASQLWAYAKRPALVDLDPQHSLTEWLLDRGNDSCEVKDADFVFIDTQPIHKFIGRVEANITVLPIRPSLVDLKAVRPTIAEMQALRRPFFAVLNACLPVRRGVEARETSEARAALEQWKVKVMPGQITNRIAFREAFEVGKSVRELDGEVLATREIDNLWSYLNEC